MNFMQKIVIGVSAVLYGLLWLPGMAIGGQESMSTCIEDMRSDRLIVKVPNWKKEDYRACWKAIEQSFSHKNPAVRISGLKTLSSLGGAEYLHDFEASSPTLEAAFKSLFQSQYLPEKVAVVKTWSATQFQGFELKIVSLLTDSQPELRESAEEALRLAHHLEDDTVHQILALLKHPNLQVRLSALRILGGAGNSKAIVNAIINDILPLLSDPLPQIRATAMASLGKMRELSVDQLPRLLPLLEDEDGQVRHSALIAIQSLGRNGKGAIPQIRKMLNDRNPEIRADAIEVLLFAEEDLEKFFSQAITMLKDTDPDVRKSSLRSLRFLGVKAPQYGVRIVVSARPLLNDSSLRVRNEAMLLMGTLDDDKSSLLNKKINPTLRTR
jgi:HEAT repeats